jgi:hypothetical protein
MASDLRGAAALGQQDQAIMDSRSPEAIWRSCRCNSSPRPKILWALT